MELGLVREIGSKALLAGGLTLLGYWIYNAVKLVLDARGINPPVSYTHLTLPTTPYV